MIMKVLVLMLACLAVAWAQQEKSVWFIKPKEEASCPTEVGDERCNTFPQVLNNATLVESIFSSNTILKFLRGDHVLESPTKPFVVRNFENFTLLGSPANSNVVSELSQATSRILCKSPFAIAFVNVSRLAFTNITVTGCGANITDELNFEAFFKQTRGTHLFGPEQKAALLLINIHTFQMSQCVVDQSLGYGLVGVNVLGESRISQSVFHSNNNYTVLLDRCVVIPKTLPDNITACSGGNALFVYEDLLECPSEKTNHSLVIANSTFATAVNSYGGRLSDAYLTRGAGLGISMAQSSYGVTIVLDTIIASGNSALIGANIYIAMYDMVDNSTITLRNVESGDANGGLDSMERSQRSSGGLHFDYNLETDSRDNITAPVCRNSKKYQEEILTITDSRFVNNRATLGAGAYIEIRTSPTDGHVARIKIERCVFSGNVGISGTSMYLSQQENFYSRSSSQVTIKGVSIFLNSYVIPIRNLTELYTNYQLNTVQLINVDNVSISDCSFLSNEGSGLSAFGSKVVMSGLVRFENNSGVLGGAINLQNSHISFTPHTSVIFHHNYALFRGGAICVKVRSDVIFPCFFQVSDFSFLPDPNVTLYFENNYAENAGSVLYGGSIDRCIVATNSIFFASPSSEVFNYLFNIGPHSNATSLISSDASQVCICVNDTPNCSSRQAQVILPPGTTLQLPFVTVGQRNGITPSSVYAITDPNTTLGQFQLAQMVGKTCTTLNFTIMTTSSQSRLIIRTSDLAQSGNYVALIEIGDCPEGFVLDSGGECVCDPVPQLGDYSIRCDIDSQTVYREAGIWINSSYNGPNGTYDGVLVFRNCPQDYCLSYATQVDLTSPDSQCDHNRTGVLCGACKSGLSVTLGTSKCMECSNNYLALLIGYVLAGFVLVTILFLLDLTITLGNLGGIIFYANILQLNRAIFFPPGSSNVITVFIAWLNLDAGLDTCFYDGMDNYAKNWFGYAFPFYIWLIVAVIIVLSRFSHRIARLCGSRSVPVLATLLLLSYNKLLRISIISLSSTSIINPDGSLHIVWSYDGNIDLWQGKHVILGITAILVLLFFIVPYTLFLLLVPLSFVQARSAHHCLSWINKLKPFTDAHQAPFKNAFRNWTGVLLVVRIVLSVLTLMNIGGFEEEIILLVIGIVMFLIVGVGWVSGGGMYKKWPQNILACSFFVNLGILCIATLYLRAVGGLRQDVVILVSGSIALLLFMGTLVYHCYRSLHSLKAFRDRKEKMVSYVKRRGWRTAAPKADSTKEELTSMINPTPAPGVTTVSFTELREPLIEDED